MIEEAPPEGSRPDVPGPILDEDDRAVASAIMARYPTPRSALVPLLYLVQSKAGWIPQQGMREVAELLGLRTAEVEAVATFYTMLKLHPAGKYVVSNGGRHPYRVHLRDPSFVNLQGVRPMVLGGLIADIIPAISSIDPVMGGVDR